MAITDSIRMDLIVVPSDKGKIAVSNETLNDALNVRVVTEQGDVIEFNASPSEVQEIKNKINSTYDDSKEWGFFRIKHEDGKIEGVSIDDMCVVRIRPFGPGERFPDSKFVEFQFVGGGFLRAVCEASQAVALEHALDESDGGILNWKAGAHEIILRTSSITKFIIDRHEGRMDRETRDHSWNYDERPASNWSNKRYGNDRGSDRNDRGDRGDRKRTYRSDRRPHSSRMY